MNYDFDELSRLAKSDPEMFELRRQQIIMGEISKAPPEQQEKLLRFQKGLDEVRATTDSKGFIKHCMEKVVENLDDLQDQWNCINALANKQ